MEGPRKSTFEEAGMDSLSGLNATEALQKSWPNSRFGTPDGSRWSHRWDSDCRKMGQFGGTVHQHPAKSTFRCVSRETSEEAAGTRRTAT